jgi:hypothetical protein
MEKADLDFGFELSVFTVEHWIPFGDKLLNNDGDDEN